MIKVTIEVNGETVAQHEGSGLIAATRQNDGTMVSICGDLPTFEIASAMNDLFEGVEECNKGAMLAALSAWMAKKQGEGHRANRPTERSDLQ